MANTMRSSGGRKASTATVLTAASTSVSSDSTRSHVLVPDADLVARAQATLRSIQFESLTDLSRYDWKWHASKNDFTLFTRQPTAGVSASRIHEVLAAGEIRCSLEEVMHVLRSTAESDYNAAMTGLYKNKFVYGSVVRLLPREDVAAASELHVTDKTHLAVKTAAFVRSRLLAKNEQWCFLECFQELPQQQPRGFTLTQSSMLPSELTVGKAERSQVTQLHDIQLGYSVQQVPGRKCVCVLFHASFDGRNTDIHGNTTAALTKARMLLLARGVARIPEIVRRRRLGAQTIANHKAFTANNARCICCTSSLRLFSMKRRCSLCGYNVCDKCWSVQDFETRNANVTTLVVCTRCVEFVDEADYSAVPPSQLGAPRVLASANGGEGAGQVLANHLKDVLRTASTAAKKNSVLTVIKHLVGADSSSAPATSAKSEQEYLDSLSTYFMVQPVPLEQCVLANAERRSYPLDLRVDPAMDVPKYPVPRDEAKRQQAIERSSVLDLGETPELDLICTLAARELGCAASFVNIITNDNAVVLASNVDEYRRLVLQREHVYCSHTVMDARPLVLPNPQADIRFCNFRPFKEKAGIKFYCGFPLLAEDNETVIGTVCCLDNSSRQITQDQYSVMDRLTRVAAKVVQTRQLHQHQQAAPVPSPA